jgi:putative ABC transport system substrate-binding protein
MARTFLTYFGERRDMSTRFSKARTQASLPVRQPIKFESFLNLNTAKALDLTVPPSLIQLADQVIE